MSSALVCFGLLPLVVAAPSLAAPKPAASDLPAPVVRLQRELLAGRAASELARALSTEVGPRLAGSEGDRRAVAWALERLRALGFEEVRAEAVTVPRWERGEAEGAIVAPFPQRVAIAALGGSVGTPDEGIEAEVVATENVATLAALPDESVRGKIVYLFERMQRSRDGAGYSKTVKIRGDGVVEAAKKGAAAVVIRSVGTDSSRQPHTGGIGRKYLANPIPAAALSNADADLLDEMRRGGRTVRFRLRLTSRRLADTTSANVVAEIRGRERPDEIVLLAAHLDSWDLGTGALDDGAGVGVVIAAAQAIGRLPERPRRTVRVVLYANEEFGLSGGIAYAREHAAELARHQAALESDFGTGRVFSVQARTATDDGGAALDELARLLAPLGVARDATVASGGADISTIRRLGVPVFDLSHDGSAYFDYHHTAEDTADKLDPEALAQASAAFATAAWQLAERPDLLQRIPLEPLAE
jgi:hypothetical protein